MLEDLRAENARLMSLVSGGPKNTVDAPQVTEAALSSGITALQACQARLKSETVALSLTRDTLRLEIGLLQGQQSPPNQRNQGRIDSRALAQHLLDGRHEDVARREVSVLLRENKLEREIQAWDSLVGQDSKEQRLVTAGRLRRCRKARRDAVASLSTHVAKIRSLEQAKLRLQSKLEAADLEMVAKAAELRKVNGVFRAARLEKNRLSKQIEEEAGRIFAHCPLFTKWLLSLDEPAARLSWSERIVTLGSDPLDENFFDHLLLRDGFDAVPPGTDSASIMIVGRKNCPLSKVLQHIKSRRGRSISIYSQELALFALATKCDPLDAGEDVLLEVGATHPVLAQLMEGAFEWPALERRSRGDTVPPPVSIGEWNDSSPLTAMGYHAGRDFTDARERRDILARIIEGRLLFPDGFDRATKDAWGKPGSRQRILRVAEHLRQNINWPGQRINNECAARQWMADFKWLKSTYGHGGSWPRFD